MKEKLEQTACSREKPISWLTIEQYCSGELDGARAKQVEAHLQECVFCSQKYESIVADNRPLNPLLAPEKASLFPWKRWRFALAVGTALVAATLLLLLYNAVPADKTTQPGEQRIVFKGGDTVLTVIRERQGKVTENPRTFREGDRFRLSLTSSNSHQTAVMVAIIQGDEVYHPYPEDLRVLLGNSVSIPGAFRLSGSLSTTICVVLNDNQPDQTALSRPKDILSSENAICKTIEPETKIAPSSDHIGPFTPPPEQSKRQEKPVILR